MKDQSFHLIKSDLSKDTSIRITTYRVNNPTLEGGQKYVICSNDKRIGWATKKTGALQIHDMYVRIHILNESNSDKNYDSKNEEIRSTPNNNGFLHDLPDKELIELKKQIWVNLD